MAVAAYMLSLLSRQKLLLGDRFFERYPSNWLVWEPGHWKPARSESTSNTEATQLPTSMPFSRPLGDDALCFELKRVNSDLAVGRGTENQIVLNDLTVSRTQLHLEFAAGQWRVRSAIGVSVDGVQVGVAGAVFKNGSTLIIGNVRMTFYEPEGFGKRLQPVTSKPAEPAATRSTVR